MARRHAQPALLLLGIGWLAGCSSMPTIHHPKYKVQKDVYIGADLPKHPYRALGLVRTKVNYPSLDQNVEEGVLCKNYFNKAAADLLKMAKRQHGDAVIDMRSVVFLVDGRSETYTTPECSDDGQEGQILAQGIAIRWLRPGEPVPPPPKPKAPVAPPAVVPPTPAVAPAPSVETAPAQLGSGGTFAEPPAADAASGTAPITAPGAPSETVAPALGAVEPAPGAAPAAVPGATPESAPLPLVRGTLSDPDPAVLAPPPAERVSSGAERASSGAAHVRKVPRRARVEPPDEKTFDQEMLQSEGGVPRPNSAPLIRN